ncbi:sugar phosphate isomerase/epimerase family protein [Neotamlana laminarinivorans]|uniref:Sugar phosphate isomerase/epimerase n=1 Tax=Neotamlana laminarinivorans TaxID=2883124 RepID=A0A9X1L522_9FLAO|nr:TIM barrel protein [Tamlana laminarinivorans]MCB4798911.1 sugar phosphate isomerase/epimerase [Tamlana laminarinivorans]
MKFFKIIQLKNLKVFLFILGVSFSVNSQENAIKISEVTPWCIIGFDSKDRTPAQRIEMLKQFGFKKYGYNRGKADFSSMAEEFKLAKQNNIEITSVFLWLNAQRDTIGKLSEANTLLLNQLKKAPFKPAIWVSFSDNFFKDLNQKQSLERSTNMIKYIKQRADALGCKIALYNHDGWFGNPLNQLDILKLLKDDSVSIVYNFHHALEHLNDFKNIAKQITPHLSYVNLNGVKLEGPQILPIGKGDYELSMIKALINEGYQGPWGILGHIKTEDVEQVLKRNIEGLKQINQQLIKP